PVGGIVPLCREAARRGIGGVLLFGVPAAKDPLGSGAYADDGVVPSAVRAVKRGVPGLVVVTDVCLCAYTDHGHCGVARRGPSSRGYRIDNDATLELLARTAVAHARAGADMVAPSDMMDGRVGAIRAALDGSGFSDVAIMSYAAKYASALYAPFRDAAGSAPAFGDRRSYQMDPTNAAEALREAAADVGEGADIVMVKPAFGYGDVIRAIRDALRVPVAAYSVSGEYAMVKAAAARGWIDERSVAMELLAGAHRAGAGIIVTYWAMEAAGWLAAEERGEGSGAAGRSRRT
ncbi:MAG: porphobilinogen synthase, partial [bacterium]|nr:porphobilinogen synthase [bacterium]